MTNTTVNFSANNSERLFEILEQEIVAAGDSSATRDILDKAKRRFLGQTLGVMAGASALTLGSDEAVAESGESSIRVMIVYTTDTNTTRRVAERVIAGVNSVTGVSAEVRQLFKGDEVSHDDMLSCHGLIIGTPVRHRTMHHRVKLFIETVLEQLWLSDAMVGMTGATFSVGGGHGDAGAGAETCQLGMLAAMAANGMALVPLPKSTPGADHACLHWGPAVRTGGPKMEPIWPTASALDCAYHHGANVARVSMALNKQPAPLFASGNVSPSSTLLAAFTAGASTMESTQRNLPADANPAYRKNTDPQFPSGDGFHTTSEGKK